MRRTLHPDLHGLLGGQVGRGPNEVLSDRPVPVSAGRVESLDPLPEDRPVGRLVGKVPVVSHRTGVTRSRLAESGRSRQRLQTALGANTVHFAHHLGVQRRDRGHSGAGRSGVGNRNGEQAEQNCAYGARRNSSLSPEPHERRIVVAASFSYHPKRENDRSNRGF